MPRMFQMYHFYIFELKKFHMYHLGWITKAPTAPQAKIFFGHFLKRPERQSRKTNVWPNYLMLRMFQMFHFEILSLKMFQMFHRIWKNYNWNCPAGKFFLSDMLYNSQFSGYFGNKFAHLKSGTFRREKYHAQITAPNVPNVPTEPPPFGALWSLNRYLGPKNL